MPLLAVLMRESALVRRWRGLVAVGAGDWREIKVRGETWKGGLRVAAGGVGLNGGERGRVGLNGGERGRVVLNGGERGRVALNGGEGCAASAGRMLLVLMLLVLMLLVLVVLLPLVRISTMRESLWQPSVKRRSWPMEEGFFSSWVYGAILKGVNLERKSCTRRL